MRRDGGWIELIEPGARRVQARAHLLVNRVAWDGGWGGELESLRLAPGLSTLEPGVYVARYPKGGEAHVVDLDVSPDGTGVRCDECELPAPLREVSEGD